ncbi:hypothetical protein DXG01_012137, partial [Tephrocybe rancida]
MRAIHDYETDQLTIHGHNTPEIIANAVNDIAASPHHHIQTINASSTPTADTQPEPTLDDAAAEPTPHPPKGWRRQDEYEMEKKAREERQTERSGEWKERSNKGESGNEENKTKKTIEKMEKEMAGEWVRIHLLQDSENPLAETRWGTYLNIASEAHADREHKSADQWLNTFNSEPQPTPFPIHQQQRDKWDKRITKEAERNLIASTTKEVKAMPQTQGCAPNPHSAQNARKKAEQDDAEKWHCHRHRTTVKQLFGVDAGKATNREELTSLLRSEIRIKQLRNQADTLRSMIREQTLGDNLEEASVKVVLDRGGDESQRERDPFNEERIQEILQKVEIGNDLTGDQRRRVTDTIREYADIFALSLSEVLPIDWYKHKLNIEPGATFPTRINQRPITEAQKTWFNDILDDMEKSHIIQKVPGTFIKALSSTNLAPKEAGKTGLTR